MSMMRYFFLFLVSLAIISCDNTPKDGGDATSSQGAGLLWSAEKNGVRLTEIYSLQFPDALLAMEQPTNGTSVLGDEVLFSYQVHNFQLGVMTGDYEGKRCANSAQGQHIHLILNNEPYTAHYETSFKRPLPDGHYVALSFLSRSYHESVKAKTAYQISQFIKGKGLYDPVDLNAPHLFYSRPKDTYKGDDTDKVLLDFYLVNCDLSADGYKVRATINGTPFLLEKWAPYGMEGLPMGENTIRLELLDSKGDLVKSPFNPVERSITLEP